MGCGNTKTLKENEVTKPVLLQNQPTKFEPVSDVANKNSTIQLEKIVSGQTKKSTEELRETLNEEIEKKVSLDGEKKVSFDEEKYSENDTRKSNNDIKNDEVKENPKPSNLEESQLIKNGESMQKKQSEQTATICKDPFEKEEGTPNNDLNDKKDSLMEEQKTVKYLEQKLTFCIDYKKIPNEEKTSLQTEVKENYGKATEIYDTAETEKSKHNLTELENKNQKMNKEKLKNKSNLAYEYSFKIKEEPSNEEKVENEDSHIKKENPQIFQTSKDSEQGKFALDTFNYLSKEEFIESDIKDLRNDELKEAFLISKEKNNIITQEENRKSNLEDQNKPDKNYKKETENLLVFNTKNLILNERNTKNETQNKENENLRNESDILTEKSLKKDEQFEEKKVSKETKSFKFIESETKLISGKSATEYDFNNKDRIGNLMLASMWGQNACYTDGNYNNTNWTVKRGVLNSEDGEISLDAYQIGPPANKAKKFFVSHHNIFYKFDKSQDYDVYTFENSKLSVLFSIEASKIKEGDFVNIQESVSTLEKPKIYVFAPKSQKIDDLPGVSKGLWAASVINPQEVEIKSMVYTIPFNPPFPEEFDFSPSTHENVYTSLRKMFIIKSQTKIGVFTQDRERKACYLLWLSENLQKFDIVTFPVPNKMCLGAVVSGNDDEVIFLLIEVKENAKADSSSVRTIFLVKANCFTGKEIMKKSLDTSASGMNFHEISTSCFLAFNGKDLALHISREMTRSGDGLNHQGAICMIFNGDSFEVIRNHGQTSGHSWGDSIQVLDDKDFIGMDLGDNYPRGINLWKFNSGKFQSKLVYAFKTAHGTSNASPAGKRYPEYTKISTEKAKFYQWSNDNRTYTELGAPGIHEFSDSFAVFFLGECPALDNANTRSYVNATRNIGFLKIDKKLENVLSKGTFEEGGFFDFGGRWNAQKNVGIKWVTNYTEKNMQISRLKTSRLCKGKNLLLFEIWTVKSFSFSAFAVSDDEGNLIIPVTKTENPIRLHKADDIFVFDGKAIVFVGSKEKIITMFSINILK